MTTTTQSRHPVHDAAPQEWAPGGGSLGRQPGRAALNRLPRAVAESLVGLRIDVDELTRLDTDALDGAAAAVLFQELHALSDRMRALAVQALPGIEADGLWALGGAQSFPTWVATTTGMPLAAARRDVRLGRALRSELPATSTAVSVGAVPLEHARILVTVAATSEPRRAALRDADSTCSEGFLLQQASLLAADPFRRLARRWAAAADPDADDRGFRDAADREFVDVAQTMGGYHLSGFLTEEHGQVLAAGLASVSAVPTGDDPRTAGQRRAQALADLARVVLDHRLAGSGAAVRPHLNVHVDLERLLAGSGRPGQAPDGGSAGPAGRGETSAGPARRGEGAVAATTGREPAARAPEAPVLLPATFDDGTPVPPALVARLACDSEVTRIVFGPGSVVLDVGRSRRTVTGQLRRAVIARDRHCRYPGCDVPPARCDVHHPQHWADGGPTSVANAVLLCWHHHDVVHRRGIGITAGDGGSGDGTGGGGDGTGGRGGGGAPGEGAGARGGGGGPGAETSARGGGGGFREETRGRGGGGGPGAETGARGAWTFTDRDGTPLTTVRELRAAGPPHGRLAP